MARIKKYSPELSTHLRYFETYLVDTLPNSQYFKVTEFKDVFTGGKNGFLIEGSEHLMESTEIKIEILDVDGNPIYYEPGNGVPEYYEGLSKVIAVYVYEDTPIGEASITILGELKTYIDESGNKQEVPAEWKGIYNVKWEKAFKVNKLLSNEDKVRFYRRPSVSISEIVKPIFSNVVTPIIQKGHVDGFAQVPTSGTKLAGYTLPTSYLLQINDGKTAWTGSVAGTNIELTDLGVNLTADDIINNRDLTVSTPYTLNGIVQDFTNQRYTASFNYLEGLDNLKTALTGSFAKIVLADLTTFVGDVARVKVFRKSSSDLADYQFIQEVQLESNELLVDIESTIKNQENYGLFDVFNYTDYWVTSSNNLDTSFNQNYLFNSVRLDSVGVNSYFTTKSLQLTQDAEYSFTFNTRLAQNIPSNNYLKVYLSGSRETTSNGSTTKIGVQQNIVTLTPDSTLLEKSQITSNFKADNIKDARLHFEVTGTGWYISDVSLRASQETSFSPDEITFIQPIPRTLPTQTFDFLFQFYDINNNYIPVVVEESKTFDGGNLVSIAKNLELIPSSLYFQIDSGSQPLPPTTIFIDVVKSFLTGSVTFTSRSFDFFNNELSASQYSPSGQYPGLLNDIQKDTVFMTVQNFTGSREDIKVQFVELTGECEGVSDTIVLTRVQDGFGGVNFEIRPYNGIVIRNSDPSSSLEVQAIRIDGVNEIPLRANLPFGRSDVQLFVQSGSTYITLQEANDRGFVKGLSAGTTGSGELNYNAVLNRDSIDGQRTLYMIPSSSFDLSSSILTSLTLTDLQDGLDAGIVLFDVDAFTINPRLESTFTPTYSSATASFFRRGTFDAPISCSFEVYPSMSINKDYVAEYWMQYVTHSCNPDISVVAYDEVGNEIPARANAATYPLGDALQQSKQILVSFIYTEPWTSASVSVDKLFTIVPEGKPGDESIVFEITPSEVVLAANSRGIVNDYKPGITDIKLKQGSRYLSFTSSREPGTFHIAQNSIIDTNVTVGNVYFDVNYTSSLIVSASSFFVDLSGSIEYPLEIQPYYTSSVYTASVIQNYTKVLDGPPPIEINISPLSANIASDEVGYVIPSNYAAANTTIKVKEGDTPLRFTTQSKDPGTFRILSVSGSNIRTGSLSSSSFDTGTINYNRFDYPFVSASSLYTIEVYPYALGPGHLYTSSIYQRTQTFTKNVSVPNARSLSAEASSTTVNYDRDGNDPQPSEVKLTANAFNTTGSIFYYWYLIESDGTTETLYENTYTSNNGEVYAWSEQNYVDIDASNSTAPGEIRTWKVKIKDGSDRPAPLTPTDSHPFRAEASVTIAGVKAGADAYKYSATNLNTSITADLWSTQFTGSGIQISGYKGTTELTHTSSYVVSQEVNDFLGNFIGNLGYFSASVHSKSPWITLAQNPTKFPPSNPAVLTDITAWTAPATNTSGEVIYKIDYENGRQIDFVTQSISVQYTPPAPYDVKLENDSSGVVYRVSGEFELNNTGNIIRAYRGDTELTNIANFSYVAGQPDAYGATGYKDKCRITVASYSGHITLQGISSPAGGFVSSSVNAPKGAEMLGLSTWTNPEVNQTAEIVYQIDCEDRAVFFKTQSLSVQFEGSTGPGIVMRGVWKNSLDYIGSVETTNKRRDAVIWPDPPTINNETHYFAAISGSGPGTTTGYHQPIFSGGVGVDDKWWQYLGQEELFVAAQIAIFQESYVKNTINVGTKDGTGAFANIVLAGGRPDPYIAIGQTGTQGTAGTSGTSLAPTGVIGYDRPGIFLGVYEDGGAGTTGRFSIKTTGTSGKGMFWDGDTLTIVGAIRQVEPGVNEGSLRGVWTSGFTYYPEDIVSYAGQSWSMDGTTHVATNNTNASTGYPGSGPWVIAAAAGTSGTAGSGGSSGANGTDGAAGSPGPGVVYRGVWAQYEEDGTTAKTYYKDLTAGRIDVVKGSNGQYYIAKSTHTTAAGSGGTSTRPIDGGSYSTYWQTFGATFSSVATGILLAENATITKGLVIGQDGTDVGFIRSANANSIGGGNGFFMDATGRFRFGADTSTDGNFVYWNGSTLDINGVITADSGEIGGFTIANNQLIASGSLLKLDTQIPQIEFYTNATGSAKVVLNPKATLTDPGGTIIYISGSQYDGTNGNRTAISGTTTGTTYLTEVYSGSFGVTSVYGSPAYTITSFAEAGNTTFEVYIPETSLAISTTSPTANSSYPPDPPNYGYESYASEYAYAGSVSATWYVQMYNSTGTTFISEVQVNGASTYRTGTATNNYYQAYTSYGGYPTYTTTYYWNSVSYTNTAYYQGNIPFGPKGGQMVIPSPGTYKFRLVLKVTAGSSSVNDFTGGTTTYYATTATSNTTATGDITWQFSPNVNKTEITNGGIQVLSNKDAYVKFVRLEPSSYSSSETIAYVIGAKARFQAYGVYPAYYEQQALDITGRIYVSSKGANQLGITDYDTGTSAYTSLEIGGKYSDTTLANQTKVSTLSNIYPYQDDKYDLGGSSYRWRDIFTNGAVTTTSDRTRKFEIQTSQLGLDFINKLQPVSYRMITGSMVYQSPWPNFVEKVLQPGDMDDMGNILKEEKTIKIQNPEHPPLIEVIPGRRTHYGLIAQDVKQTLDEIGVSTTDFAGYVAGDVENDETLGLRYEEFISPMIKAIQELSSKVNQLELIISGSIS